MSAIPGGHTQNLRTFLTGTWDVHRTLRDLDSGATGTFTGTTDFSANHDGGLLHKEQGMLVWDHADPVRAVRNLIWRPGAAPSCMNVFFADGRPFHSLELVTGEDSADHWCPPDLYRGTFRIEDPARWSYSWRVTGPHKDLELKTVLIRVR